MTPPSVLATSPLTDSRLDFDAPDFRLLGDDQLQPVLQECMQEHLQQIEAIAADARPPTFENTLEAIERSGARLWRAYRIFSQLNAADGNGERDAVNREMAPRLAAHMDRVLLDQALFERVRALYERRERMNLDEEQQALLERHYTQMERAGARLGEADRERLQAINQRLAELTTRFQENVRQDTAAFLHRVEDEKHLAGLSPELCERAREEARSRGQESGFGITLQEPVVFEVLAQAEHRPLRQAIYTAYKNRGNNGNEHDNNALIAEIVQLRAEAAKLLGYETHAHYVLADNMAATPDNVREMLLRLWRPAVANAAGEAARLQQQIEREGQDFRLEPWDWWFYAERVRRAEYALDEAQVRPYLELGRVRDGAFMLAGKLWGLSFRLREDLPGYHPDVQVFEVRDADDTVLGLLYMDHLTRPSKRFGAWMLSFQVQARLNGTLPLVTNTANFGPATPGEPVLLTFEQAGILFHEFGHALHGLLSDVRYPSLSGTSVVRDFLEMPSQLMENWLTEPEMLRSFARHHRTGEPIPQDLIDKLVAARRFNEGFAATEYLASSLLDLAYHLRTVNDEPIARADEFERRVMAEHGLPEQILPRHRSTHFMHIFAGGYSAGYYSYIWAEVLDADAFEAFKEGGLFSRELGQRLRDTLLSRGGGVEAMTGYVRFRGREPEPEPLLRRRGLLETNVAA